MKRILIIAAALLGISTLTVCAQNKEKKNMKTENKALVAYFSASGVTERVAQMIAKATDGELYEIKPQTRYSDADLDWTDKTSRCCKENDDPSSRPAIVKDKANLDEYDVIYLGYPNWWNMAPRIINSFVEAYNLKGKTVIPFMTSGGSRIENSVKLLKKDYPEVNWQAGRLLNGANQKTVDEWIKSL